MGFFVPYAINGGSFVQDISIAGADTPGEQGGLTILYDINSNKINIPGECPI